MKYKLEKISKFIDFVLDGLLNFDDLIKLLIYFYIIDNDYLLLLKLKILFIKIYVKKKNYILIHLKILLIIIIHVFYLLSFLFKLLN